MKLFRKMMKTKLKSLLSYSSFAINRNFHLVLSQAFINGAWVDAKDGATFTIKNPADGEIIGCVPNMNVEDVKLAISAAKNAFESREWRNMTGRERANLLKKWHELIALNTHELAEIITAESGKPISESRGEIAYGNSFVEWFAEEAPRIYGELVPSSVPNREVFIMKQPLGVVALITPWNFPMALFTRKAAAALAAGCTLILKPAEDTPLTALAVAKLAQDAGYPNGVVNVVTCDKSQAVNIGDYICKSPHVHGISFTGSTAVGKLLYAKCAVGLKRVSLELGGNAPFIVFDSANLEKAIEGAMVSKFRNCGQTCVSANRFYVQEGIYDSFLSALKKHTENLKIGVGSCKDTQIGPLINEMQLNKVASLVKDALDNNGKLITGGQGLAELGSLFYAPTIIAEVNTKAKLYWEEVFGPVISIMKFKTEEEVIFKANQSLRGLASYFFSHDIQQIFRVAKLLEVGMVGINVGLISTAEAPFGGVKESGIGREGSHYGIDEFVEIKYICLGDMKY